MNNAAHIFHYFSTTSEEELDFFTYETDGLFEIFQTSYQIIK